MRYNDFIDILMREPFDIERAGVLPAKFFNRDRIYSLARAYSTALDDDIMVDAEEFTHDVIQSLNQIEVKRTHFLKMYK